MRGFSATWAGRSRPANTSRIVPPTATTSAATTSSTYSKSGWLPPTGRTGPCAVSIVSKTTPLTWVPRLRSRPTPEATAPIKWGCPWSGRVASGRERGPTRAKGRRREAIAGRAPERGRVPCRRHARRGLPCRAHARASPASAGRVGQRLRRGRGVRRIARSVERRGRRSLRAVAGCLTRDNGPSRQRRSDRYDSGTGRAAPRLRRSALGHDRLRRHRARRPGSAGPFDRRSHDRLPFRPFLPRPHAGLVRREMQHLPRRVPPGRNLPDGFLCGAFRERERRDAQPHCRRSQLSSCAQMPARAIHVGCGSTELSRLRDAAQLGVELRSQVLTWGTTAPDSSGPRAMLGDVHARVPGKNALYFVAIAVFLDVIGFSLILPILPRLLMEVSGASLSRAAIDGGWLSFVYAAIQFVCAPILGGLSDRFGRRPVLLYAVGSFGIDYLIMGFAPNLSWLFLGRVVSGISGASYTPAYAAVADLTPPEKRAQNFGLISAAFGIGFVLGPAIGGLLSHLGVRAPFFVAAILSFANLVYGIFVLPESLPRERRRAFEWRRANPLGTLFHVGKQR